MIMEGTITVIGTQASTPQLYILGGINTLLTREASTNHEKRSLKPAHFLS